MTRRDGWPPSAAAARLRAEPAGGGKEHRGGILGALIRLLLLLLAVELVFFLLLRLYLRSLRVERLERQWDARHPEAAGDGPARRAFIARAMTGFERSLKGRLTWLVFVLPTVAVLAIVVLVNWR